MNYSEMEEELLNVIPELKSSIDLIRKRWGDRKVPTYILYEETLNTYLHQLLVVNLEVEKIRNIFSFYERMAICKDEKVQNLLEVALLEYLWTNKDIRETAIPYMQPNTKKVLKDVTKNFN